MSETVLTFTKFFSQHKNEDKYYKESNITTLGVGERERKRERESFVCYLGISEEASWKKWHWKEMDVEE